MSEYLASRYCSRNCRYLAKRNSAVPKLCATCGKEFGDGFAPKRLAVQRFCSNRCRRPA